MNIDILSTRTVPTIQVSVENKKVVFHSKYDPLNESITWCKTISSLINSSDDILVIGLGAGYHINQLAELHKNQNIIVIEFNNEYYDWFMNSDFACSISQHKNVSLYSFTKLTTAKQKRIFSSFNSSNIAIHKSGTDLIPKEYDEINKALKILRHQQNTVLNQVNLLYDNFNKNIELQDIGIRALKDCYKSLPMVLVSAGPSLDKQLPLLKCIEHDKSIVIGAVGTALKPLLAAGITPDFFMITDPSEYTYSQLTDIYLPSTPLLYLSTAYHETILLHKGPRYIVYQHGFSSAEKMAKSLDDLIIQTGGSVATTLLDTMRQFQAKSVALIGQDLAYTNNQSHAEGAHLTKKITQKNLSLSVQNYYKNGYVHTSKNLSIYRKWFESYAIDHPDLLLYNCTEGGSNILNWINLGLDEYIQINSEI